MNLSISQYLKQLKWKIPSASHITAIDERMPNSFVGAEATLNTSKEENIYDPNCTSMSDYFFIF